MWKIVLTPDPAKPSETVYFQFRGQKPYGRTDEWGATGYPSLKDAVRAVRAADAPALRYEAVIMASTLRATFAAAKPAPATEAKK